MDVIRKNSVSIVKCALLAAMLLAAAPVLADTVEVRAYLISCHDGDTCDFDLESYHVLLGTFVIRAQRVRLDGLDTPEMDGDCKSERDSAAKAQQKLEGLLKSAVLITVRINTAKPKEKYGRWLGVVLADGRDVAAELINAGLARPYSGGKRAGWCG